MTDIALPRGSTTDFIQSLVADRAGAGGQFQLTVPTANLSTTAPTGMIPLGDSSRHVGLRFLVGNMSANDTRAAIKVILVHRINIGGVWYYQLREYGTAVAQAGTMQAGSATKLMADTITWTPLTSGPGLFMEAQAGNAASAAFSPTANGLAEVWIPDLDNAYGIVFDTSLNVAQIGGGGTASSTVNVFHRFTT